MIKNIISKKATYSAFFNTESTRYLSNPISYPYISVGATKVAHPKFSLELVFNK